MKHTLLILFAIVNFACYAQHVDKLIKEADVSRVIKTLSADEMLGRSAKKPEQIEKAAVFIESEFKKIGLQPLPGLKDYRQTFNKKFISNRQVNMQIDGEAVPSTDVFVFSEKPTLNYDNNLPLRMISYNDAIPNKDQFFFDEAFANIQDTIPSLILVDEAFRSNFMELKRMFSTLFLKGRKYDKIFVMGRSTATNFSVELNQKIDSLQMTNIVGMLKGSTLPEDMVIFSGHYDHLGIQPFALEGDSISNGADDDASGTTAVIALAKYFKARKKNNRSLIFVAFTAEEIGGYGSKYFSQQLNAEKITAMFNIEMIGKPSKWGQNSVFITGYEKSDLGAIIQKNLSGSTYKLFADPYPEQDLFYRSDNATLARLGVPAHTISTDQIPTDAYYHTVNDEFETLDVKNITQVIKIIALGSQSVVDGQDTPRRINRSEVR